MEVIIPANTQAYMFVIRDDEHDKFDVKKFVYNYRNTTFPSAWGYWKFEEATGVGPWADASGNNRQLVCPEGFVDPGQDFDSVTGKVGNAIEFVDHLAYSDEVQTSDADPFSFYPDMQHFFTSFWFKVHSLGNPTGYADWYFINDYSFTVGIEFDYETATDKCIVAWATFGGLDIDSYPYPAERQFSLDEWHFLSLYYDGVGLYLEVDNELIGSVVGTPVNVYGETMQMGGIYEFGVMTVAIDEMGLWLGANADAAIAARSQLWNGGAGWSPY